MNKKKIKFRPLLVFKDLDKTLLIITIIMFVFGLLNIATASSSEAVFRYNQGTFHYFKRQLTFLVLSIIPFIYIINTDTKKFKNYAVIAYFGILGVLIYLLINGVAHKGATAWINIFGFTFQPSEFSKPIIIVLLSVLFEANYKLLRSLKKEKERLTFIAVVAFIGIIIPVILFFQKDLGTAMIVLFIFGVLFLTSPMLKIDKFRFVSLGLFSFLILILVLMIKGGGVLTPAQMKRFTYFDPCSRYQEPTGYQTCNAFIAINDGGLFGLGMGKSKQKYSYLAEPHTDSIFAIVAEEYGFIRSTFVFVGYIIILKRILDISAKAVNLRGRYMALGVAAYIFIHLFLNLGGLLAIIPLTGVPLPFISYGGSYAISLCVALAVVQRIHIETVLAPIKI